MNAKTALAFATATLLGLALAHPTLAGDTPAAGPAATPAADTARETASDRTAEARPRPLRGAACIDPRAVRTWHDVEDREKLLVDAGRKKYRITLNGYCPGLGMDPRVAFVGDNISGRLCGNFGDRIVVRGESCRIQYIELLDDETYAAALARDPGMGQPKPAEAKAETEAD